MKFSSVAVALSLSLAVMAAPHNRRLFEGINFLDDVLVFDAPAFQDPASPENTLVDMQSFVFLKQLDLDPLTSVIGDALEGLGLDVGDKIDGALERIKLFAAVGLSGKEVEVKVDGCSETATLPETSLGVVTSSVSVGQCDDATEFKAEAVDNDFTPDVTIFPSPPDGFGVISDIDDTIKISNVLDKIKLAQTTLLDDPTPVAGMPELYASLAQTLNSPQFIYVSGSPFQLYPFLRDFISTSFAEARGPLFLRNLTITDLGLILDSFSEDEDAKLEYKLSQIARIQRIYPQKNFLAIGDSTEKDPEIYAEAFKTHGGDFIRCIWIHLVEGAENSDERFAAAFKGVPEDRIRLFDDSQIATLADIDVAGGQC
ncbi:putative actin filament organization protein App1-like [Moniliophthora roreri MCA 2997]|uniref:Actin filament organization protein App1-like n=1 Tax=Moniliophthora roreri (strain MCA 2997) TaxID=1381753 RepID=V2WRU0_MONRO|nr:putative actin filament organization protein App1-like [Moniliophthora roreri MCA 2997]